MNFIYFAEYTYCNFLQNSQVAFLGVGLIKKPLKATFVFADEILP